MEQPHRLPLRLLPRKRQQIGMLLFFGFFLGFSIFWMAGASGIFDPNEGTIHVPPPGGWIANSFALFGLPFAAVGIGGMGAAVIKMLPNSPYYHLEINAEGLMIRSHFKQKHHAWRELPAFETLEHRRRTKNGTRIRWYTIAVEAAQPERGASPGSTFRREVVRIDADEYGAKNGQQDAIALASWLNGLRDLALDKRLSVNETVEVPACFAANAITVARHPGAASRAPTVVRS